MGYYGALLPNPYFAKEGGRAWWGQGWRYLGDFVGTYWLWLPTSSSADHRVLHAGSASTNRRRHLVIAGLPLAGLLHTTSVIFRVGGDFMHARLLLPAFMLVLVPVAVVPISRATASRSPSFRGQSSRCSASARNRSTSAGLASTALICDHREPKQASDHRCRCGTQARRNIRALRIDAAHHVYLVAMPVDTTGHPLEPRPDCTGRLSSRMQSAASPTLLDPASSCWTALGLADPLDARFAIKSRGLRPGHEKAEPPAWVWARLTAVNETPDPSAFPSPASRISEHTPTLVRATHQRVIRHVGRRRPHHARLPGDPPTAAGHDGRPHAHTGLKNTLYAITDFDSTGFHPTRSKPNTAEQRALIRPRRVLRRAKGCWESSRGCTGVEVAGICDRAGRLDPRR